MNLIKNESANVYTWIMLCTVVIVMAGIYLISIQVVGPLTDKHDELNDRGKMTEQNVECFNTCINFFTAFPVIMLFGLAIWAVVETIKSKGE